jgi:putative colanic acid biosynthesis acetyltransferase WcaF
MPNLYAKALKQHDRYTSAWSVSEVIRIRLWNVAWLLFFRMSPKLMNRWRVWLLRLFGATVTGRPFVYASARVYAPFLLTLGDHACLGPSSEVYNLGPVRFDEQSTLSQHAYVCNGTHDFDDPGVPLLIGDMVVGRNVFIGARAFIMPGVSLGEGAIIGACAVVTKDVAPWTVVAGNPAREIRKRNKSVL